MTNKSRAKYDVIGLGNAVVDVLAMVDEEFVAREGMRKSTMTLIDATRAEELYQKLGQCTECSGGSVANSMAGLASLGAKTAFIGRVREDQLGHIFRHDLRAVGVDFDTPAAKGGSPTARCLICVTPDAQRTMNTYIGACAEITPDDIDEARIAEAETLYVEGYLWDQPAAKDAIRKALRAAKQAGRKVAFSLSDVFCVERHQPEFWSELIRGEVDILFANEMEARTLCGTDAMDEILAELELYLDIAVITRSEKGAIVAGRGERHDIPALSVENVVDTTGAGDLFAAGFLYGLAKGWGLAAATQLGHRCASEIIQQVGARSLRPLDRLVA